MSTINNLVSSPLSNPLITSTSPVSYDDTFPYQSFHIGQNNNAKRHLSTSSTTNNIFDTINLVNNSNDQYPVATLSSLHQHKSKLHQQLSHSNKRESQSKLILGIDNNNLNNSNTNSTIDKEEHISEALYNLANHHSINNNNNNNEDFIQNGSSHLGNYSVQIPTQQLVINNPLLYNYQQQPQLQKSTAPKIIMNPLQLSQIHNYNEYNTLSSSTTPALPSPSSSLTTHSSPSQLSSPPTSPKTTSQMFYNQSQGSMTSPSASAINSANSEYDILKEYWQKARDISQEIIRVTKQATKSDFTLVDHFPNLQKEYEMLGQLVMTMSENVEVLKYDERQQKKRKESDKNAEKRKKRREATMLLNNVCKSCGATDTPEWRRGPDGTKSLCNACGLHYAKNLKRETLNAQNHQIVQPKESMKVLSILNSN